MHQNHLLGTQKTEDKMLHLYEIRPEYDAAVSEALAYAEEHDGEIPTELSDKIDLLASTLEEKAIGAGHIIKNSKAEAEAIAEEIRRLQARKQTIMSIADSLKAYLERHIIPGMKINTPTVAISWRSSKETVIDDLGALPAEFQKITIEAKKKDIKDAIQRGETIAGAHLENKNNLQIK